MKVANRQTFSKLCFIRAKLSNMWSITSFQCNCRSPASSKQQNKKPEFDHRAGLKNRRPAAETHGASSTVGSKTRQTPNSRGTTKAEEKSSRKRRRKARKRAKEKNPHDISVLAHAKLKMAAAQRANKNRRHLYAGERPPSRNIHGNDYSRDGKIKRLGLDGKVAKQEASWMNILRLINQLRMDEDMCRLFNDRYESLVIKGFNLATAEAIVELATGEYLTGLMKKGLPPADRGLSVQRAPPGESTNEAQAVHPSLDQEDAISREQREDEESQVRLLDSTLPIDDNVLQSRIMVVEIEDA